MTWLGRYSDYAYAILRVIAGVLFACHGAQKLFGLFGGHGTGGSALMLIGAIIEFFGGLLIAGGLFTDVAAFLCSGEMAVAYFRSHAPNGFWPIQNRGELAVIFAFLFLYIAARGAGRWSIDAVFRPRKAS